ncbi:glycosyltransferase [Marinoscillum furvescens]|uniref:Cellulose synthase/poly-beta-1,6-N-acetylglucosamine synthase-like glycosyltransferase n=1 Tax=Marinoscillum furvescens DSM 4134 TaxID=1122208 RepID=A0A3D9L0W5_MARFU|nr:glycosyltransferase [Marinoscillum furvescens]RED97084.1 cellulose synthase/poly-beta-1,6-N-acetylglucosamine synthase-like glycosyltransferase [Marinoscillum furvescens DSM 4134]
MVLFEAILLIYFGFVASYTFFFAIAAIMGDAHRTPVLKPNVYTPKFCVLIPAYKEDTVIVNTAQRALDQSYPTAQYDVVVIADSLKSETLQQLHQLPITTVEVHFENSTKVKALNAAMAELPSTYDYGVILDADNVMEADFLQKLSVLFHSTGAKVIQGQRKPKNQQTTMAFLDGLSEAINTTIFRKGTSAVGWSSAISGSGFATAYPLLKKTMQAMDSVGGFDKELEILLLRQGHRVCYVHQLAVYDEKVGNSKSFQNQRKRWISSQYLYLTKYLGEGLEALARGRWAFVNSSILRNVPLPRLINIGLLTLCTGAAIMIHEHHQMAYWVWVAIFALNTIATFLAIPKAYYSFRMIKSILYLPSVFIRLILAFVQSKSANKKFIHTPHEV